jgi:hypothetical protein
MASSFSVDILDQQFSNCALQDLGIWGMLCLYFYVILSLYQDIGLIMDQWHNFALTLDLLVV